MIFLVLYYWHIETKLYIYTDVYDENEIWYYSVFSIQFSCLSKQKVASHTHTVSFEHVDRVIYDLYSLYLHNISVSSEL